jgi:hypothetical protein
MTNAITHFFALLVRGVDVVVVLLQKLAHRLGVAADRIRLPRRVDARGIRLIQVCDVKSNDRENKNRNKIEKNRMIAFAFYDA